MNRPRFLSGRAKTEPAPAAARHSQRPGRRAESRRAASGRQTAVGPGDRRDGQPLIFGWGRHLTRAQKQRYRERFVLAAGVFVFLVIALVLGIGALQKFYLRPRYAVATVNGQAIELQWYQKNLAYQQFVLQHQFQNAQNSLQALNANARGNAAATATAAATASGTPGASATPASASPVAASASPAGASASPAASASPSTTPTPAPTLNPRQSATAVALEGTMTAAQTAFSALQEQTVENLIDVQLMQQNAAKLGISVTPAAVSAQVKKITAQLGGQAALNQLFQTAHMSQSDFNQIQHDSVLKQKYRAYFAAHPSAAPAATPTVAPTPTPTTTGPAAPTPTPSPTAVPTPGAGSLARWLAQQRGTAKITRAPFPLPTP